MNERLSKHTIERISQRLDGLVTERDIRLAVLIAPKVENEEKIYVGIRRFGKMIKVEEYGYSGGNGSGINGDCLVAVIKSGVVITIMIGKESNKEYWLKDSRRGLVFLKGA